MAEWLRRWTSKSIGVSPRRFESCRLRQSLFFPSESSWELLRGEKIETKPQRCEILTKLIVFFAQAQTPWLWGTEVIIISFLFFFSLLFIKIKGALLNK